jgi:hypothetical protein
MATASHVSTDPAFETNLFWEHYKWAIIGAVASPSARGGQSFGVPEYFALLVL